MMSQALKRLQAWQSSPTAKTRIDLERLLQQMQDVQNEHRRIRWANVRIITDPELLIFEYALRCVLCSDGESGFWAYQTARHYAERYHSSFGTGLVPESIPLLRDIVDFWMQEFDLTNEMIYLSAQPEREAKMSRASTVVTKGSSEFTHRQGQFLAFIRAVENPSGKLKVTRRMSEIWSGTAS